MNLPAAIGVWAAIVALAALTGMWLGLTGRPYVIALSVAAGLFAFEFFLAAPRLQDQVKRSLGGAAIIFAPLVPLFAALIYSREVAGDWRTMLAGAAYVVVPALLLATCATKAPGTWQDYLAVALIFIPVEFNWLGRLFGYPAQLTHTLMILLALSTGVSLFVFARQLDGIGYRIEGGRGFGWNVLLHFALFAAIAIPVGMRLGFLIWEPSLARLRSLPITAMGILFFTAWPEEFLFRGLLQNLLSRSMNNRWAGLVAASAIFGLSHILHAPYPNWKYVLLATIAGLFYGHVWMKSGSIFPGALVHGLVDISWHILFR